MTGFYIVRVPGIVRVIFRDTYPHYIGPPTVLPLKAAAGTAAFGEKRRSKRGRGRGARA